MERFSRRRWTTGSAQQSNMFGIMHVLHNFLSFDVNITAFYLGHYVLHILLLKSSVFCLSVACPACLYCKFCSLADHNEKWTCHSPTHIHKRYWAEKILPSFLSFVGGGSLAVWPDWAIICALGNFYKPSKSIIFLVKSFLATFIDNLQFFSGHTAH